VKRCAGILLCAEDSGQCLFLLRDDGLWDLPGGHAERHDRTALDTALRELSEETGYAGALALARPRLRVSWCPELVMGHIWERCRTQYTGFVGYAPTTFEPQLDPEHVEALWAYVGAAPEPLLPGVDFTLAWAMTLGLLGDER
jgi:8-oxo-dGTP pyrophosphatase MutT (NUDIX family)